jgi:hypothetical protein
MKGWLARCVHRWLHGASPRINGGDESVYSTTTGTAPVDNLDQRGFIRPGPGAANCSIGAFELRRTRGAQSKRHSSKM